MTPTCLKLTVGVDMYIVPFSLYHISVTLINTTNASCIQKINCDTCVFIKMTDVLYQIPMEFFQNCFRWRRRRIK